MNIKKIILLILAFYCSGYSQLKEYRIHERGMLHETVFNTGEIGRSYHQGQAGNATSVPVMEWPSYSRTVVNGRQYDGQHNTLGAGVYLAADAADTLNRMYAFCGGVGSADPELVTGKWAFPLIIYRDENYPLLKNGDLNPSYNPNEAEEIIVAKWATPLGITITRTSRAWSFPDYDDFIIYEYEIENTGDRDGDPSTVESMAALTDVLISFVYTPVPNMFAYQLQFGDWNYQDIEQKELRARWDRDRWLSYALDQTGRPAPTVNNQNLYDLWGRTGINGGGLTAPQAPGFSILYYDTQHLAVYGETQVAFSSSDSAICWDAATGRIKQPWINRMETTNLRSTKVQEDLKMDPRKQVPYKKTAIFGPDWVGRGSFNHRQSKKFAGGRLMTFGPYTLRHGDKARFTVAEVVGYGAASLSQTLAGMKDEGGSCGEMCGESTDSAFYPVPNWTQPITYGLDNTTYGSNYLSNYNLPDYVNSNVVTVKDVTEKAKEIYTGDPAPPPFWPEMFPAKGDYSHNPIPVPAPVIVVENTPKAENVIKWKPSVETFNVPRLQGSLSHYLVYKASHPLGPWRRLDSVGIGDTRYFINNEYSITDPSTQVGESYYYSVVSIDNNGKKSGRTNITFHETQLGGLADLDKVYAVPNPFVVKSGSKGAAGAEDRITFQHLPKVCTIKIFSYSGQLIETINHESGFYSEPYFKITRNDQNIASGVYFFVVQTPEGKTYNGKFVVIR